IAFLRTRPSRPMTSGSDWDESHAMNDQNIRIIGVINPYTGELAGTVPKATVEDVRRAFSTAAAYQSPLTRHGRATILQKAAELLRGRAEEASDLITRE